MLCMCLQERKQWYVIVDVPMILVVNFEAIRTSTSTSKLIAPVDISINSVHGSIQMKAVAYVSYSTLHWTSNWIDSDGETTFHYDDLRGYARRQPFSSSALSHESTTAVVYLRKYDDHGRLPYPPVSTQHKVIVLNRNKEPVGEAYVFQQFVDDISIVKLISIPNGEEKPEYNTTRDPASHLKDALNMHIVWPSSLLQPVLPSSLDKIELKQQTTCPDLQSRKLHPSLLTNVSVSSELMSLMSRHLQVSTI